MNAGELVIGGAGAVSAAGWGVDSLMAALHAGEPLPHEVIDGAETLRVRRVPVPESKPEWLRQPRLRRASPITRFGVGAALEALGPTALECPPKLAVVVVAMNGSVQYSGRFYAEVRKDPVTASPILFPETVFNAPGSHLAALLRASGPSATLVGDPAAQTLGGLELAQQWLDEDPALDGVLLVGLEELDRISAAGLHLVDPLRIASEGAFALWLRRGGPGPSLAIEAEWAGCSARELADEVRAQPGSVGGDAHWIRNGGCRLPRERVLEGLVPPDVICPQEILGELFAASSLSGLVAAAALAGPGQVVRVADPGVWHGGFLARVG